MPSYTFIFSGVHIDNTRSARQDTDYASLGLIVGGSDLGKKTRRIGDVNNGDHGISNGSDGGPAFGPMNIDDPNAVIQLGYGVVNTGHSDTAENAADAAVAGALALAGPVGLAGAALGALAGALGGFIFANCDGVVVAGKYQWTQAQLSQSFGGNSRLDLWADHAGYDSPSGCGSNSIYKSHIIVLQNENPPVT